jgi:hypothetical protein
MTAVISDVTPPAAGGRHRLAPMGLQNRNFIKKLFLYY